MRFRASRRAAPGCVDDVRELVAASRTVRVLGTGHSFNDLADTTGLLLATSALPKSVEIDARAGTVTVGAGVRFGELTGVLHASGHALHNLGSLPHISVAGACATGTHGAGVGNPSLAAAVRALELVTADGELLTLDRSDERFPGSVVALGALGVVTRVTLGLVPAFDVRQWVYEGLPTAALRDGLDEVLSAAYSVSLFTRWRGERVEQVWLKQRVDGAAPVCLPGARLADGPRHPVPGMAPEACTPQGGVPGPWHTRLPHFRLEHIPSSGAETQSEYFVARSDASAAFAALDRVREEFAPVLRIGEVRAVAADDLWLSPAHRRDSVAFHFTWLPDAPAVAQALHHVERALAPFAPRPHWGKVFVTPPETLRERYEHHDRFRRLMTALDPAGKFRNDFLRRHFPEA
ncbi:FAD-binding protein [Streptantibioticus cattleyicolor]|uniref:FAD-binding protein n=1 Tax=Streptantibioticus cattleyicolor TaxID=29303 RepID=UPI0005A02C10|nr:FAD-binding protein [Streptantibioticus cattleyicolor]